MAREILVIDDELSIRNIISDILKDEGFTPKCAAGSSKAFEIIEEKVPAAVILDVWLEGSDHDGLGMLEIIKKKYPLMPVIVMSGHGTIETAVAAIKMGAYDYLEKPFTQEKLMILLKRACENAKLKRENYELRSKVVERYDMIGTSGSITKLKAEIERVAPTAGRVLITGEAGSGKELAARLIHKMSKRSAGNFVPYNASGKSQERTIAEIFGEAISTHSPYIKRLCLLEQARNSTFFLDEVTELPLETPK